MSFNVESLGRFAVSLVASLAFATVMISAAVPFVPVA